MKKAGMLSLDDLALREVIPDFDAQLEKLMSTHEIDADTIKALSLALDLAVLEFMKDRKIIGGAEIVLAFDASLSSIKAAMLRTL